MAAFMRVIFWFLVVQINHNDCAQKKGQQKRLVSTTIPVAQIGTPSVQIDVMDGLGREGPNALNACIGDRRNCMTVVSIMNHKSHGCMIKRRRGGTLKA